MLRILYDHTIFRMETRGGISRYVLELARRVPRAGIDVHVFGGLHRNDALAELKRERPEGVTGVRAPASLVRTKVVGAVDAMLLGRHARGRRKYSVVHPTHVTRSSPRLRGAGLVATVYDMIPELFPSEFAADPTAERKRALVSEADLVLCISRTTADDVVRLLGVDPAKLRIVLPGRVTPPAPEPTPTPPSRPFFLFVGARQLYKNWAGLLDAWASAPDLRAHADLVCFGGGELTTAERARMDALGVEGSVHWRSGPDDALFRHYRSAACVVIPSLYEGFGLPALEAMTVGTPVIAHREGAVPEVLGGVGSLVDARDPAALAAAMRDVLDDAAVRARAAVEGPARAALFDWDVAAEQAIAAYREVAG